MSFNHPQQAVSVGRNQHQISVTEMGMHGLST
jgi:hypothetical protein